MGINWLWWIPRAALLGLLAFVIFGPLTNLLLWTVAEKWFYPHTLPNGWGFSYWGRVFSERSTTWEALSNSVVIACLTVLLSLALAVPAGYALARLSLPWRGLIMVIFLIPQAFPNLTVYVNIARSFYQLGLNGTILGVVIVHTVHGLVLAVWIAAAAFAAVAKDGEEAARSIGASPLTAFFHITLPQALPGLMAASIFVFLESLDEFSGSYFVGAPDVQTLPLMLYTASSGGNYQTASITALVLLIPSILFMLAVERFLKAEVLAKVGQ